MAQTMAGRTVAGFSQALGSSAPTPGGGGASAVVAGIGVALGQMVASLTQGKERYADVQERIGETGKVISEHFTAEERGGELRLTLRCECKERIDEETPRP